MIVAITGDRRWTEGRYAAIHDALATLSPADDFVVLGDARGVDSLAFGACETLGLRHRVYRADWDAFGRAAGPIRNRAMLDHPPDEVWYFHDDLAESKGTRNMVEQARKRGLPVRDGQRLLDP